MNNRMETDFSGYGHILEQTLMNEIKQVTLPDGSTTSYIPKQN